MPRSSQARARSVTGSARSVTKVRMPTSSATGSLLRPEVLRLLEVLERLVLHAFLERLVAGLVLLARIPEVLPLRLGLLVLREEVLLDLGCSLVCRPRGAGEGER